MLRRKFVQANSSEYGSRRNRLLGVTHVHNVYYGCATIKLRLTYMRWTSNVLIAVTRSLYLDRYDNKSGALTTIGVL